MSLNNLYKLSLKMDFNGDVICDWMSFRHDFSFDNQQLPIAAGRTLKITADGQKEWEKQDFSKIVCKSSDTSVRIKCDGKHLWFQGNIGRFTELDNLQGLTVAECFKKAVLLINRVYPKIDTSTFGLAQYDRFDEYLGTVLTRIDLASNFSTDSYHQLATYYASRKLNTRLPVMGKYGPTWGYDTKRGQYWKAKLYDKQAELDGKRTPYHNETTARFEVQLGSEYLRQNGLNLISQWGNIMKTENIIYGKFITQLTGEPVTAEDWSNYPKRLRQHAVLWRDGTDPKSYLKHTQYYKVRRELLSYGLDISRPCNVMNLTRQIKVIEMRMLPTLRRAA
jgi:Phage X family